MNPAERSAGQGFSHGMYDPAAGGFGYESLHILHGSHYSAYYSDALLLAAWTEGQLAPIASKPQWYREKKDMVVRQVAITCVTDGFTIDVPDDADTSVRAAVARVRATYRTGDDGRVLVRQHEAAFGRLIDVEDRVHLCIRLVRELAR